MNIAMDYIFESLATTKADLQQISKKLRSQHKTNRSVAFFMLITTVYIASETVERLEQRKKIAELTRQVEELKRQKGDVENA